MGYDSLIQNYKNFSKNIDIDKEQLTSLAKRYDSLIQNYNNLSKDLDTNGKQLTFYADEISDLKYVPIKFKDKIESSFKIIYSSNAYMVLTYTLDKKQEGYVRLYCIEINDSIYYYDEL